MKTVRDLAKIFLEVVYLFFEISHQIFLRRENYNLEECSNSIWFICFASSRIKTLMALQLWICITATMFDANKKTT